MKRRFDTRHVLAFILSFLLLGLSLVHAETGPQRIEMRAGGPPLIIKGEIRGRKEVVYVFKGERGQKFSGRIKSQTGDASFAVTDPDGDALPEEEFDVNVSLEGSLKKSGDYKITINTVNSQDSKYSLSVRIY